MEVIESKMERLQVNLLQDKIEVEPNFVEQILNDHLGTDASSVYKNPAYVNAKDYYLDFKEDRILVTDKNEKIIDQVLYLQMNHVAVSMCSRWPSIRYNRYQVDLDIDLNGNILKYEIFNPQHFLNVIEVLEANEIEIIDMAQIVSLFKKYPDYTKLGEYLGKNFNEISKKYGLDHPRID